MMTNDRDEDILAGVLAYEQHVKREEALKSTYKSRVWRRPSRRFGSSRAWQSFIEKWIRKRMTKGNAHQYEAIREAWMGKMREIKPKFVGWYPSSNADLSPIVASCPETMKGIGMKLPRDYRQPDLWILSDTSGNCARWKADQILKPDDDGINGYISECSSLDFEPSFPGDKDTNKLLTRALSIRRSRLMRIEVESAFKKVFTVHVLLLDGDDEIVFSLLRSSQLRLTHSAVTPIGGCSQLVQSRNFYKSVESLGVKWIFSTDTGRPRKWKRLGGALKIGTQKWDACLLQRIKV